MTSRIDSADDIASITYVPRTMRAWDIWLRDVLDIISSQTSQEARIEKAVAIASDLDETLRMAQIDDALHDLGKLLIDSVIVGYYNAVVGVRCIGLLTCEYCACTEQCARYEFWRRLYSSQSITHSKVRMGAFLAINLPFFDEQAANTIGIYTPDVFVSSKA